MKVFDLPEDFIQFVWKFQLFHAENCELPSGAKIQVIHPGNQNKAGGPDFFNAKIYIGETLWVGNVEIHHHCKQWKQHKHHLDAAYNNIILHVVIVGNPDEIVLENGRSVETISLENLIYPRTFQQYAKLQTKAKVFIPCQGMIAELDTFDFIQFYEPLLVQRLQRKVKEIEADLSYAGGDIDLAFVQSLFKYFGAPLNKEAFHLLSRSFSFHQLSKQAISVAQLESFLFGLAQLLDDQDAYAKKLQNEFDYTQKLYGLKIYCEPSQWQFAGTRPPNFPTIRIAQLAALLYKKTRMFSDIKEATDLAILKDLFVIEVSSYWKSHYNFGKASKKGTISLSKTFIDKLIINVIVPFLFFYGEYIGEENFKKRALDFLMEIAKENNQIVRSFENLGAPCTNAFDSQALIELKTSYCQQLKCLECRLGFTLLK